MDLVDILQKIVPQLENYPAWFKWCVATWIMLTASLLCAYIFVPKSQVPQIVVHPNHNLAGSLAQLGLRSPVNDVLGEVRFINRLEQKVDLYWIDNGGQAQRFASLENRDSFPVDSYEHHMWVFVDEGERPIAKYETRAGKQIVVIEK